jgi:hypothetical protein
MSKVLIFKLINGDEIFGTVSGISEFGIVTIDNPMISETRGLPNGNEAMVINRYVPYLKTFQIELSPMSILLMGEVTESLQEYYDLSLQYARLIDTALDNNIQVACRHMKGVLSNENLQEIEESSEEDEEEDRNDIYRSVLQAIKPNGSFH